MTQKSKHGRSQSISNGLAAYATWRSDLTDSISAWRKWLVKGNLLTANINTQFNDVISCIKDESLNIAFISEYSRGKTELINAIFFGDSTNRTLPSGAGRTTMCPTEIFYDSEMPLGLQLLPVETLNNNSSLSDLKNNTALWTSLPFDNLDHRFANEALNELSKTIRVPSEVAKNLGFTFSEKSQSSKSNLVEIPKWRHALVNIKHPLLKNNLVIHDTPGLNALGIEAKLTLETLENMHSTVFVLDASTGATKSDKRIWDRHVKDLNNVSNIVALNKLDALWNSRTEADELREQLQKIISSTSKALNIDQDKILSVSAHNAIVGKLENKPALVERSRIAKLEQAIAENLIPAKKKVVLSKIFPLAQGIAKSIDDSLNLKIETLRSIESNVSKKQTLNDNVMSLAMNGIKTDKDNLQKSIHFSKTVKAHVNEHIDKINLLTSDDFIEKCAKSLHKKIKKDNSIFAFKKNLAEYFTLTYKQMHHASIKALEVSSSFSSVHRELHPGHNGEPPLSLNLSRHVDWLMSIENEYKNFKLKANLTPKKQERRIRKIFEAVTLATGRAFRRARNETNNWHLTVISPYDNNVKQQTLVVKRRITNIKNIDDKIKNEGANTSDTSNELNELTKQKRQLYALIHNINSHLIQHDYKVEESFDNVSEIKDNVINLRK